jgi:hypothetical protein
VTMHAGRTEPVSSTIAPVTWRLDLASKLVAVAGVGLVGYGIMFLVRNFTGFIELGLTPELVGGTREDIQSFSQDLYEYISHLQVAISGFIIALGIAVIGLAWYGIRRGQRWAIGTALLSPLIALVVAIPLHYAYGIATMGHLGLIYLDALILLAGIGLAFSAVES